jgi:hypothetical protein
VIGLKEQSFFYPRHGFISNFIKKKSIKPLSSSANIIELINLMYLNIFQGGWQHVNGTLLYDIMA